jgi:cation diffusion facilitator CzcD-associated flavoprotein CzcO
MAYLHSYITIWMASVFRSLQERNFPGQQTTVNTVVESVEPAANEQWTVHTSTGEQTSICTYQSVVVCSGRDHYPELVHLTGSETFVGRLLHSSSYKGQEAFAGKRIVVD